MNSSRSFTVAINTEAAISLLHKLQTFIPQVLLKRIKVDLSILKIHD